MTPKSDKYRYAFIGGPKVSKSSINGEKKDDIEENNYLQFKDDEAPTIDDVENAEKEAKKMTDEEIKIKALNQATNIAKLFADVTVDDVISIAKKIAKFIKG